MKIARDVLIYATYRPMQGGFQLNTGNGKNYTVAANGIEVIDAEVVFWGCRENCDGDKSAKYVPYRFYAAFMNPFVIERRKTWRLSIWIARATAA